MIERGRRAQNSNPPVVSMRPRSHCCHHVHYHEPALGDADAPVLHAFFYFFWIHYCAPRERKPHVALRDCVLYYVCNARYEGSNNSGFFSHSKGAIDTQCVYKELTGTTYACQMTVMPVVIRVPSGLLNATTSGCAETSARCGVAGREKGWRECDDVRIMGVICGVTCIRTLPLQTRPHTIRGRKTVLVLRPLPADGNKKEREEETGCLCSAQKLTTQSQILMPHTPIRADSLLLSSVISEQTARFSYWSRSNSRVCDER